MISIISCSRTKTIDDSLSGNIGDTIGCAYELIVIDNSENKYTIFEAYNEGINRSTGDYLCFIHDDILFNTKGWGANVHRIFNENESVGLIGVAGAKSKTRMPSVWWLCPDGDNTINIIQHFHNKEKELWNFGFENEFNTEVVAIDGVFMAMRKDNRLRFNTKINGYHNYDLNISFECKRLGYKIMVTNEILLEHFSSGKINNDWVESSYRLYTVYKNLLPLNFENNKKNKEQEIANALWFINECLKFKKYKIALIIWIKLFYLNPFLLFHVVYWKNNLKNNLKLIFKITGINNIGFR